MASIEALELGPCVVKYGASGSEVDLGFTKGGVTVTVETTVADVTTDQLGEVIAKQILVGRNATIKVPFAETDLALMAKIIPLASHVIDSVDSSKKKTVINTPIGADLVASAAQSLLLIKAIGNTESTNANDRFRFYKATPQGELEFSFSIEDQRVFEVEFVAYPDINQDFALGVFGDESAS